MKSRSLRLATGAMATAVLIATLGCAQLPAGASATAVTPTSLRATATQHWNDYARDLIARSSPGQAPAARMFAYLTLAQRNAAVLARLQGPSTDGAVAGASAEVLAFFFPSQAQAIDAQLAREVAALGGGAPRTDFTAGVEVGKRAGVAVVAAAKADHFDLPWSGPAPSDPRAWVSQARPPQPPILPRLGEMRPFFLARGSEFRAPPPPARESEAFRMTALEVRTISDDRTVEQLRIAQFWEQSTGSLATGWLNQTALEAAQAHNLSQEETAQVLALMHMAAIDATIACHDSKYVYWVPRPPQVDPAIRLAIGLPNHPSYPANHACITSAAGRILDAVFPDQHGRYLTLGQEAARSRVYGGIHYPIDTEAGLEIGRKVAAKVLTQGLPPDRAWVPSER